MDKSDGERRFLRRAIPPLLLLAAAALALFLWYAANKGALCEARAERLLAAGRYEAALVWAERAQEAGADAALPQRVRYAQAAALLRGGESEAAEALFLALGGYEDSALQALACRYARAEAALLQGDTQDAAALFAAAAGYADALERHDACRYALAEALARDGQTQAAFSAFRALGGYADAHARAGALAGELTGEADAETAIALAEGYSAAQWEHIAALERARAALERGSLACGAGHAVSLAGDGRAEAWGDDAYGQCQVGAWRGVTALAAGARHTLGLTADGRVLACGDDSFGQCGTAAWTNVAAIAASDYDSYALTADGRILHCGFNPMPVPEGWDAVARIAAGSGVVLALRRDGSFLCSYESGRFAAPCSGVDIAGGPGWSAAVKKDGRVLSETLDLSDWSDVLALESSSTVLCALREDGTLAARALTAGGEELAALLRRETDVAALTLSGGWALVRTRGGALRTLGDAPAD